MSNKFELRLTPQVEALSDSDKRRLVESFDDPTKCLHVAESLGLELKKEGKDAKH